MEKIENQISYDIRAAAFSVYNALGPGLLESIYEAAMEYELLKMGHQVSTQLGIPVRYKDIQMDLGFRLDILVDDLVIVEIKSIEALAPVHYKVLLSYLRLKNLKLGLLINFNTDDLASNIKRVVNNL
jgi:GxxExxY protein